MASGKDAFDLYDGDVDLLDYGDDLEADLLDGDLAGVGGYDDLDLGAEDELGLDLPPLDAVSSSASNKKAAPDQNETTAAATKEVLGTAGTYDDDVAYDETDYTTELDASVAESASSKTNINSQSTSNDDNRDASPSQKRQSNDDGQSKVELGGFNRQSSSPSDDRSSYNNSYNNSASSSPRGDGRSGGLRGRGNQGYGTGTGRGNYQGGRGGNMMGMGMSQQQIYAMQQMGMNMNMMGMGMNGGRYSGDGYGNQGMGYPYNGGSGMGGSAGTPGRTIHINPKFQNRAGVPAIPGSTATTTTTASSATTVPAGLDRALGQDQRQGSRQLHQDSGNGQSPGRRNQSSRSGSQDRFDNNRFNRNQQYNNVCCDFYHIGAKRFERWT
ncbi:MAG: hypothetical protein JOS17DRAFT_453607 [Linnemannia elongata]|nr:MAG: hypothetical protein JOS17DRAFT_453607 [Linnemannia elongata]